MASFIGTYTNRVDRKGRVSVPARFRAAIAGQPFNGIVVSPNFDQQAVDACDHQRIEEVITRLDQPGAYSADQRRAAELILSRSEEITFDSEGRIIVPPAMMELSGIGEQALFVGIGRTFQIWNPERRAEWEARSLQGAEGTSLSLKDLYTLGGAVE
jgi:MraZ protein